MVGSLNLHIVADATAVEGGRSYRFQGASGEVDWPIAAGAGLGIAGAWNLFWRVGVRPALCSRDSLPAANSSILVVPEIASADRRIAAELVSWAEAGGWVLVGGCASAFEAWSSAQIRDFAPPYRALAYTAVSPRVELIAPPGWQATQFGAKAEGQRIGCLSEVFGERQTPSRASIKPLPDAPAICKHGRIVFANGNPFTAFQAWLQGQEDVGTWLGWRHRLFWFDEYVCAFWRILRDAGVPVDELNRPGLPDLPDTTVILRHDLDDSRDTAYLDENLAKHVNAVHAILLDANTDYWTRRLATAPSQEAAFHYNTIARESLRQRIARRLACTKPTRQKQYSPAFTEITRGGLAHQVAEAQKRRIPVSTLHRHGPFIVYPEVVDELATVHRRFSDVGGSSSYFRGQTLRWGAERVDGAHGTVGDLPDAHYAFWYPFRLGHAGEGGRVIPGWEMTCMMECELELIDALLSHQTPELRQRIIMLNYHPAHANRPTFDANGSIGIYQDVVALLMQNDVAFRTLAEVFELASAQSELSTSGH